jgi:hypothetical protein
VVFCFFVAASLSRAQRFVVPRDAKFSSARSRVLFPARQCIISARSALIPNHVVDLVVCRRVVELIIPCSNPTSPARFKHDLVVELRLSLNLSVTLARCSIKDFS